MIGMDSNHCRVVSESISGERKVDEQTFLSMGVLYERLEHLKKFDNSFEGICFSPEVERLQNSVMAVS